MKYRQKLLEFIFNDDLHEDALMDWIASMPLLEQPDILREFEVLVKELAAQEGRDITKEVPDFNDFNEFVARYED
ncbi:MAG: hypothetical protein H7174_09525 [Flavobacterium sp.]|nr:hypothetical protein [Flavobacterium sp.]